MKTLDERLADYAEKLSLGLLLGAFISDVHPAARVLFVLTSLLAAVVMVAKTDSGWRAAS
ncbi:MAG: hypothetical protein AAGI89_15440 [Pseudomonadota bacterium]